MNTAMDRWGVASSSAYQNSINKENDSKSNAKDSKSKRKPLKEKQENKSELQQQQQLAGDNKSYSSGSSASSSSRRKSGPVSKILDDVADLPPPLDDADSLPPPVDNVHTNDDEEVEVSTIAGDTFAGVEMDANIAEAVPPFSPQESVLPMPMPPGAEHFDDAMITPTYSVLRNDKKRVSRIFSPTPTKEDEETTLPESPEEDKNGEDDYGFTDDDDQLELAEQGNRLLQNKPSLNESHDDFMDEKSGEQTPRRSRRLKCILCAGCTLAFVLLLGIAALGYTLYAIRNEDEGALSLFTKEFWENAGDKIAFWKKDNDSMEYQPATYVPTSVTSSFSSTATFEPTEEFSATKEPITPEMDKVLSIVQPQSNTNTTAFEDSSSVQYSVAEWLSMDPALENYSEQQIVQRYALGVFYQGILGSDDEDENSEQRRKLAGESKNAQNVRDSWMTYGEECTSWSNTETKANQKGPCNEDGTIRSIHLENAGLVGTLAPELALLSDTLESLYLTKNQIHGTIPTEYGQLTNLKRLQLSRNILEGSVNGPEFLKPLEKLEIIGLGGNKLGGPIPEELGSMPAMVYINIPYNDFTGSIPSTWTSPNLEHVSVSYNELSGEIPETLTGLESLKRLFFVGNENLSGSVSSVCVAPYVNASYNVTANGMDMSVDCELVHCDCCGCEDVRPVAVVESLVESRVDEIATIANDTDGGFFTYVVGGNRTETNSTEIVIVHTNTSGADVVEEPEIETPDVANTTEEAEDSEESGFPSVDDASFDEALSVLNGALPAAQASEPYGCQSISVGFQCYTSGWSIDFELSNSGCGNNVPTTDYDLVALYPFQGDLTGPSMVGSLKHLDEASFWATSCGLAECDGVIANGQVYYRNTYPKQTAPLSPPWWPVPANNMMQVQWIRVDASGTAIVLAESAPFLVANQCA